MLDEHRKRMLNICVNIMVQRPDIFFLSNIIYQYAVNVLMLSNEDLTFYHKYSIESRINLKSVIDTELSKTDHIRYFLPTDKLNIIEDIHYINLKSILSNYIDNDNIHHLDTILKNAKI
jgi:hypothetical protein